LATTHSYVWSKPPQGVIKLNVDAATTSTASWLAVVARNGEGKLLLWWAKGIPLCDPLFAEAKAEAVLWALQLALSEQFLYVIIEGDSQICMDSLNGNSSYGSWSVSSICNDILALCKSFSGCNLC
jgi:hypothetical protein